MVEHQKKHDLQLVAIVVVCRHARLRRLVDSQKQLVRRTARTKRMCRKTRRKSSLLKATCGSSAPRRAKRFSSRDRPYVSAGDTIQTQADGRAQDSDDRRLDAFDPAKFDGRHPRQLFDFRRNERARHARRRADQRPHRRSARKHAKRRRSARIGKQDHIRRPTRASASISNRTAARSASAAAVSKRLSAAKKPSLKKTNLPRSITEKSPTRKNLSRRRFIIRRHQTNRCMGSMSGATDIVFRWQSPDVSVGFDLSSAGCQARRLSRPIRWLSNGRRLTSPNFTFGGLLPGIYYWRRSRERRVRGRRATGASTGNLRSSNAKAAQSIGASDWQVESSAEISTGSAAKRSRARPSARRANKLLRRRRFVPSANLFGFRANNASKSATKKAIAAVLF